MEVAENISCLKGKVAVDLTTVTRWLKKFHCVCKNLDNQIRSSRPKTVGSEMMLQAIEANLWSSTQRVSGEPDISQISVVCHFHDLSKSFLVDEVCLSLPKYWKMFYSS